MIDILVTISVFGFLAFSVLGVIVLIPVWITASTEAEKDVNHIYNIFWEEAGFRGYKILSAPGVLFPFILLALQEFDITGLVFCAVASIACGFYHSSVYKNYRVLTKKMILVGIAALAILTVVGLSVRFQALSVLFIVYSIMFVGTSWGGYAVYRRARLVRITRLSS